MNIQYRFISFVAPTALALVSWLPSGAAAAELDEAQVTQVVQDVKVVPSNSAARAAAVNETVTKGTAVRTGAQSRSELTFKDKTITRLGEKTIFNVGQGARAIEMGGGQFLLYVPKKAGGNNTQIKMGPVTAAITGTTVLGNVDPSGIVEFTVLEGSGCMSYGGQSIYVQAGQMVVYDPIAMRLENPVEVDLQQQLSSPLVRDFRQLPSQPLIEQTIQSQRQVAAPNGDLDRAVRAAGAASIATATPDQFMQAFNSLLVSYPPSQVRTLVAGAIRARPDLANRINAAAAARPMRVRGYGKDAKDFKEYKGKEIAAPECPPTNQFVQPYVISPITPQQPVSPEQPPTTGGR